MSAARKEILLKAVLQAITTYAMGILLLPNSITQRLNKLMRKFWWGFNEDSSKIQWLKWDQLIKSKDSGGLGFRDFKSFNLAMLAKQTWCMLLNLDSLTAMIIKQKYFPSGELLGANLGSRPSFLWMSLVAGLGLLKEGLLWRIGNGQQVRIWDDRWLSNPHSYMINSPRPANVDYRRVADLFFPNLKQWKE